jgi:hypothetical protein
MLEMFFAMPFLLFIMVFGMNVGKTYLTQQRAMVAARYVAWSDVQRVTRPSPAAVAAIFFHGEPLDSSGIEQVSNSDQVENIDDATGGQDGIAGQLMGVVRGTLSGISSTQRYVIRQRYRPVFAANDYFGNASYPWYPEIEITGSISVDSDDWHYPNPSVQKIIGPMAAVLEFVGKLIRIL